MQYGCFPSNLTEKLQWMATCFCKQFARNSAVSPDRLCIALFSNHSLIHWLSRYLLQIPAVGMLWDQSRSMLHLLSFVLFKIQELRALSTVQGQGQIQNGNFTFSIWCVWAGGARGGAPRSLTSSPGTYSCAYSKLLNRAHVLAFVWFLLAGQ